MNKAQFTKFLDQNNIIRKVFLNALNPQTWVLQDKLPQELKEKEAFRWEVTQDEAKFSISLTDLQSNQQ